MEGLLIVAGLLVLAVVGLFCSGTLADAAMRVRDRLAGPEPEVPRPEADAAPADPPRLYLEPDWRALNQAMRGVGGAR